MEPADGAGLRQHHVRADEGVKTYNNAVNVDGNGNPVPSLAELAASLGKAAGVVATVQFSDATPSAGGGAHNVSRTNAQAIAQEMFSVGVLQVIAGTGNPDYDDDGNPIAAPRYAWIGEDLWSALENDTFRSADGASWNLLQSRADIQAAGSGAPADERLAMIAQAFTGTNFYRSGDDPANEDPFTVPRLQTSPTLTEMSRAVAQPRSTSEFDEAVRFVIDWAASPESKATWGDTMLVVTADHDHLLFGPEGETIPYQPVQTGRDGDGVPEYQWLDNYHSNQLISSRSTPTAPTPTWCRSSPTGSTRCSTWRASGRPAADAATRTKPPWATSCWSSYAWEPDRRPMSARLGAHKGAAGAKDGPPRRVARLPCEGSRDARLRQQRGTT